MKITKIGHCCLLVEVKSLRILTDPGSITSGDHVLDNIDVILITHEHGDHLHTDSLKEIIAKNPEVKIYTNTSVGNILQTLGISYQKLDGTDFTVHHEVKFEAVDGNHVEIYEKFGLVHNTGYFIDEKLFYPGDAYTVPSDKKVPILAAPIAGPWCKTSDAIRYIKEISPRITIPVHDGLLNDQGREIINNVIAKNVVDDTDYTVLNSHDELDVTINFTEDN
ncbi:MBL fold metallo-hydrolase [Candidatus Kaiserbacteria bacterium]|nr:MBL fold metallo-hydrolase [Candidatus Kaiserbacteria bacterium]